MRHLLKNNRGATAVEFGLVSLPVLWFILGIMQIAWILWADNMLHYSVDIAARCGAIGSVIWPCNGYGANGTNMKQTAQQVFRAVFNLNGNCSNGGIGLVGTYTVNLLLVSIPAVTLTANSCYPTT
jgi:Flp pilus assembly protein TadG